MDDFRLSPPTPLPWEIFVVPGSHFDLGWVLHGDGSLAMGDHIIHEAIELIRTRRPEFRFLIEYTLFLKHFVETFPECKPIVREMLRAGQIEVGGTMTGMMEQILDGEALVRQITHAIAWLGRELDYTPVCTQHTDLPGHTIQMPQILARAGIGYAAYSRYRPPCPLHWWEAPDGSRVLACNHVQHYEWGRVLRKDLTFAEANLLEYLRGPLRELWPAPQVLMPEERDLDWVEPQVCEVLAQWNVKHGDVARMRFALLREFFDAVDTSRCPTYRGEAPYGFYSIPAFEPQTYQQCRLAENAILAAERWSAIRQTEGLGTIGRERLHEAWEDLFWPHDHNIAGQDGPINDSVRTHRATNARVAAESVLREVETSLLIHADSDPARGKAFIVVNPLSWRRSGVVELAMEFPIRDIEGVELVDEAGKVAAAQILDIERAEQNRVDYQLDDPDQAELQATVALLAEDVPASGYKVLYVRPASLAAAPASQASTALLENDFWQVELDGGRVQTITCKRTGRQLAAAGRSGFFSVVALEDLRGNLEDGYDPWDPRENPPNFTGREWTAQADADAAEVIEHGPVRTRLRLLSELLDCPIVQEIEMYESLPRLTLKVAIDWAGIRNRQVRLRLPFNLNGPTVTYETPYGSVVVGRDEMPGAYQGDGTRWVQKWIDLSEAGFGITMSAGCAAVNFEGTTISPLLVSTTYCRGDAYYWTHNRGWHEFAFTLETHDGDWRAERAYGVGWEAWSPLRAARSQPRVVSVPHRRCLPTSREYVRCDDPGVVVTVFKEAEDGRGHVLRLFNVTADVVSAQVALGWPIGRAGVCDLNERPASDARFHDNLLEARLGPFEIATYRLQLG